MVGKSPSKVDQESASDEQMEDYLDENSQESEPLSREELTSIVRQQRREITNLQERMETLEQTISDVEGDVSRTDEIVKQLNAGELGGEAGADLLLELAAPPGNTKTEALARQIYRRIVEQRRVGDWIKTSRVKRWTGQDHNTQAHRAMEKAEELCEDGVLLGHIEIGKRNGQRAIRMTGSQQDDQ